MFPIKKKFIKEIVDSSGNKLAEIPYEQATVYERYEFMNTGRQTAVMFKMVEENIKRKIKDGVRKEKIKLSMITNDFIQELIETRYKTCESIFTGGGGRKGIEQGNILLACEHMNVTPHELLHEYTMEEYLRYLDGIIFNGNEQSKDGRLKNDKANAANDKDAESKQENFKKMGEFLDTLDK